MCKKAETVALYGITHAFIDAGCIFALYFGIKTADISADLAIFSIVLYNVIAFGLQVFFGAICDKYGIARLCAGLGCVLTAIGVLFYGKIFAAAIILGLGNAMFHTGGGVICLKAGEGKAAIPGMFVAPGALGLFFGAFAADKSLLSPFFFVFTLLICAILIGVSKEENFETKPQTDRKIGTVLTICALLIAAIAIRSFIGLCISLDWRNNFVLAFLLTLAVFAGKFFGGIIADKFGLIRVTVIALVISSPLIAFGINSPFLFAAGMFFFNFAMPVTLTAIANAMPNRIGFAFGLTTFALLAGAIPYFAGVSLTQNDTCAVFAVITLSAIFIFAGLKKL